MKLKLPARGGWTLAVLIASAAQRGGTFASTLYLIWAAGAVDFAKVVPLLPIAPLVAAAAILGQDQAVLRSLISSGADRLSFASSVTVASLVAALGAVFGLLIGGGVALAFDVPVFDAALSAIGGTLLAVAGATSISQIRAARSEVAYIASFSAYGVLSVVTRVVGFEAGLTAPTAWAVGDAAAGLGLLVAAAAFSRPRHGGLNYDIGAGVRYGYPLLPHTIAQQLLGNADRWIFAGRVQPTQLAIYVAAYQLANIVNIALAEVNRSRLHRYVGLTIERSRDAEASERRLLLLIVGALSLPIAAVSGVLAGENGWEAFAIALGICLSFGSLAFYMPVANVLSITEGRTQALASASFAGAAANLTLNFALVNALGVWAGVIANFSGFAVMFLVLRLQRSPI